MILNIAWGRKTENKVERNSSPSKPPVKTVIKPAKAAAKAAAKPAVAKVEEVKVPCYTYMLKLESGEFHIGHAEDLREKLLEHRDGGSAVTGKNPKLQYFELTESTDVAVSRETELKKLLKKDHREIMRMIARFHDLVGELEFK